MNFWSGILNILSVYECLEALHEWHVLPRGKLVFPIGTVVVSNLTESRHFGGLHIYRNKCRNAPKPKN